MPKVMSDRRMTVTGERGFMRPRCRGPREVASEDPGHHQIVEEAVAFLDEGAAAALLDEAGLLVQGDRGLVARVDLELEPGEAGVLDPREGVLEERLADALTAHVGAYRHPERRD